VGFIAFSRHRNVLVRLADLNDLPITLPNPNSTMLVRPLAVPLGLAALCIGFVLWKFMGDVPGALKISLSLFLDTVLGRGREVHEVAVQRPLVLPVHAALDSIKARDSSFQEGAFLERASAVAQSVIQGWQQRDLAGCRESLSPDCWQAEQKQLSGGVTQSWRQRPADVKASAQKILGVKAEGSAETITVRMQISPSPEAIRSVRGRRIAEWLEDWTFSRSVRLGPKASNKPTLGPWRLERMDHVAVHFERAA
jgi:hypothetical protein